MKRFRNYIILMCSILIFSCSPFAVTDNLLIVNADFDNSAKDENCEVYLFDKRGRELTKTIGEIKDHKLTV